MGLKGAIGGSAGLLNAAMRSLNDDPVGFSATAGGGGLETGFGAGAAEASEGDETGACFGGEEGIFMEAGNRGDCGCWAIYSVCFVSSTSGSGGSMFSTGAGVSIAGSGGETGSGSFFGLLGLEGLGGAGGSYLSTKFLGKMPSCLTPELSVYSP